MMTRFDSLRSLVIFFTFFVIYIALLHSKIIYFQVWQQVLDFYEIGQSFTSWSEAPNPYIDRTYHLPRASLLYPVIFLSRALGYDLNLIFSLQVILVMLISSILSSRILLDLIPKNSFYFRRYTLLLTLTGYTLLAVLMNGRLAFSFLGLNIFYYQYLRPVSLRHDNILVRTLLTILAGWFCSVSTGTFSFFTFAYVLMIIVAKRDKELKNPLFVHLIVLSLFSYQFLIGIKKNLAEHGWSLVNLATHGWGRIAHHLEESQSLFITVILIALLLAFSFLIYRKSIKDYNSKFDQNESMTLLLSISSSVFSIFGTAIFFGALPIHAFSLAILVKRHYFNQNT